MSKNIEQGVLVNGSIGKIIDFLTTREAAKRNIAIAAPPPNGRADPGWLRGLGGQTFGRSDCWPLVQFETGRELLCAPLEFEVVGFMGNVEAHRFQVPLILAWALSIHKSQGQTLTRVKVDLGQIFEKGQGRLPVYPTVHGRSLITRLSSLCGFITSHDNGKS